MKEKKSQVFQGTEPPIGPFCHAATLLQKMLKTLAACFRKFTRN